MKIGRVEFADVKGPRRLPVVMEEETRILSMELFLLKLNYVILRIAQKKLVEGYKRFARTKSSN